MLQLKNIKKSYTTGSFTQEALNGISLEFRKNEFVSILGPSGSGKSTMLNILSGIDKQTKWKIFFNNVRIDKLSEKELTDYRRD